MNELVKLISDQFAAHKMTNPKRQAEDLLCDLFNCSRSELYSLKEEKKALALNWMERRLAGEPLAYISEKVHFYGCDLKITPAVLIPRPETEILVDKVVNILKNEDLTDKILWDLCCGSGCIGIALKKRFPALTVYLSDYSEKATALAAHNATQNQVEVKILIGDLFAPFQGMKAHYIVSNPPYISEDEYASLDREVKDFEPRLALVAGNSGLDIYDRLARVLPSYLYPHGKVWLEIGYNQGNEVKKLFQVPFWKNQKVENDWAGHHRFFFLENE